MHKLENESDAQFIWRVCQAKDTGTLDTDWYGVAEILNKELGQNYSEAAYRKPYQQTKRFQEAGVFGTDGVEQRRELERLKIQLRDERREWQKQNYSAARVAETMDIVESALSEIGKVNFPNVQTTISDSDNEMIVCLSDLHLGLSFDSTFGKYNSDIAKQRIGMYLNKVETAIKVHGIRKIHVCLLGDIISGQIHKTIAIANKENVIQQIKLATELISEFCHRLSKQVESVLLYSVVGNHSRIDKKEDALHDERLDDIIPWAVSMSLSSVENFHYFKHRNLDSGIVDVNVCGKSYILVHGDFDQMSKSGVSDLCMFLGFIPEAIVRGHMHSPAMNEFSGVKMIQSGSLSGSGDDYTIEKRLSGKPSQTILICNKSGIDCIYNVEL